MQNDSIDTNVRCNVRRVESCFLTWALHTGQQQLGQVEVAQMIDCKVKLMTLFGQGVWDMHDTSIVHLQSTTQSLVFCCYFVIEGLQDH